ncbi:MAG: TonB family protein [bacterium]|nr:TonB family protein [bacterium]
MDIIDAIRLRFTLFPLIFFIASAYSINYPVEYSELLEAGDHDGLIAATLSQYDLPPDLIIRVKAEWPQIPREMGMDDSVLLLLYIDENGDVLEAFPAAGKRKTHPDFEMAAVNAALKYKFDPATLNGEDVGLWYPIEIIFYIEGK